MLLRMDEDVGSVFMLNLFQMLVSIATTITQIVSGISGDYYNSAMKFYVH